MIYLDSAATTKPKFFAEDYNYLWMNSNMPYATYEQKALEGCREDIKKCLGVNSGKVLFCRCATNAVEWLCRSFAGKVYCKSFEHDSVYNEVNQTHYEDCGFNDLFLEQYVNQLTGKIFDIEADGQIQRTTNGFFGSDFTAAINHAKIPTNLDTYCDAIWASSHKFHGPKNQGFIWLSDRLFEYLGGSSDPKNNFGLLHGTLDVPGIYAMTDALKYTCATFNKNLSHYRELTDYLFHYAENKELLITEKIKDGTPAIHAITIPNVNADALTTYLASKEIYVGAGHSACSDEADYRVLKAFGYTQEQAEQTIRVSFGEDNTLEDIEALVDAIVEFKKKF